MRPDAKRLSHAKRGEKLRPRRGKPVRGTPKCGLRVIDEPAAIARGQHRFQQRLGGRIPSGYVRRVQFKQDRSDLMCGTFPQSRKNQRLGTLDIDLEQVNPFDPGSSKKSSNRAVGTPVPAVAHLQTTALANCSHPSWRLSGRTLQFDFPFRVGHRFSVNIYIRQFIKAYVSPEHTQQYWTGLTSHNLAHGPTRSAARQVKYPSCAKIDEALARPEQVADNHCLLRFKITHETYFVRRGHPCKSQTKLSRPFVSRIDRRNGGCGRLAIASIKRAPRGNCRMKAELTRTQNGVRG